MNIFYLDPDPKIAAQYHCDKHVVKMIVETAQMLSTAHWMSTAESLGINPNEIKHSEVWWKVLESDLQEACLTRHDLLAAAQLNRFLEGFLLDGKRLRRLNDRYLFNTARTLLKFHFPDKFLYQCYAPTHVNHPSSVWSRSSSANYRWLASLQVELCHEYTRRYGRIHQTEALAFRLASHVPDGLSDAHFSEPPQAMFDDVKVPGDSVAAYRNYYIKYKVKFAKWKNVDKPDWFNATS